MTFDRPLLLLALLAVPAVLAAYLLAQRRRTRYAVRYTNLELLAQVAGGRSWRRWIPPALFLLALASSAVALARPNVPATVARERATVVLVIDVSGSMRAKDVRPTRLGAAQRAVRTFLERVPNRLRVGMIAFAGEPQVTAPATTDRALVGTSLDQLDFFSGFGGTAIGDALAAAVDLGQGTLESDEGVPRPRQGVDGLSSDDVNGLVSILLLSDGAQTRGLLQPLEGAERAKAAGIPVYTVALGTPDGYIERNWGGGVTRRPVPPDPATLRAIAGATGGEFFEAETAKTLEAAYAELGSNLGRTRGEREITFAFLGAGALFLVGAALFSGLWAPRLP